MKYETDFFENCNWRLDVEDNLFVPIFYVEGAFLKFKMIVISDEAKNFKFFMNLEWIGEDPDYFTVPNFEPLTYRCHYQFWDK